MAQQFGGGGRCMHRDLVMIKGCAVLRFFFRFFFVCLFLVVS